MSRVGKTPIPPQWLSDPAAAWFFRRPFFWWSLAALACIHLAYNLHAPPWMWALPALGGCLTAALHRPLGTALVIGALFGSLTAAERRPPHVFGVEGSAITMRGEVTRVLNGRFLFRIEDQLAAGGWTQKHGLIGVRSRETPPVGSRLELSGLLSRPMPATNPGGYDERLDWLKRGVHWTLRPRARGIIRLQPAPPSALRAWIEQLRSRLVRRNEASLSPLGAFMANGFLLGEQDTNDPELARSVSERFRDSGTIHLLVVSGTQVSLVMGAFIWLGWRLWRLRFLFWTMGLVAVGVFYLMTDGDASVTRAAVMGGVVVAALALSRELNGENTLGIAGLALLAMNRFTAFDIGAQLSFAAVWGLMRLAGPLAAALGPRSVDAEGEPVERGFRHAAGTAAATIFAASLAAHLATAPILALHFQRVSWSGILANVPMAVLTTLFTYGASLHTLLGAAGVDFLAFPIDYGARSFSGWAGLFARPPFGAHEVLPFPAAVIPLYFAVLALPSLRPRSRPWVLAVTGALLIALFVAEQAPGLPPSHAVLRAIDIGQGDAILLQTPEGGNVLVDAGPADRRRTGTPGLVRTLRAMRIRSLDALVVTHADNDHTGGVPRLLEWIPVRLLVHRVDPEPNEVELWGEIMTAAAARRIPIANPAAGDRLHIRGGVFTFLGPLTEMQGNEASLVFRWDAGGGRYLLTGDAGAPAERAMLRWGPELKANVLKVGHHGSSGSTTDAWLKAVAPRAAVISCGRGNRFGHPAPSVLERLKHAGVEPARTDTGGMITAAATSGGVRLERFAP